MIDGREIMMCFKKSVYCIGMIALLVLSGCSGNNVDIIQFETESGPEEAPIRYKTTGVHDPSVIKGVDRIFIVGSHLDSASTLDYVDWMRYGGGVKNGNPMIPNVEGDMSEAFEWANSTTFWAGDIIQMKDGKYYYYYSVCEGGQPLSAIGYAVSDTVEGPYVNQGLIIKSGKSGKLLAYEPDRNVIYDANVHPNAIDPTLFYSADNQLWMVYGSYSGGIYVLEMDEDTKMPKSGQGYGVRLTGGKHTRIENPYIIYDERTEYYYLYTSFGGLGNGHGYQTRVSRSKDITGPYLDSMGQDMMDIEKQVTTFFDDAAINPYGLKLMGDFEFVNEEGKNMGHAYNSPGGASLIYDETLNKTMFIFHTRFPNNGEGHEVRTHEVYMNEDGWPVIAPIRYSGQDYTQMNEDLDTTYQFIINELVIIGPQSVSKGMIVKDGNTMIDGETFSITQKGANVTLEYGDVTYRGVSLKQWDVRQRKMVKVLTLQGDNNTTLWAIEE